MIFEVRRTSLWSDKSPYEKCIPLNLTRVDERCFKSFEEYDNRFSDKWTDTGTNHRVLSNGNIARDIGVENCFGIEINSLEELMKFYADVGSEVVLRKSWVDNKTPCLEIYDDYRE